MGEFDIEIFYFGKLKLNIKL